MAFSAKRRSSPSPLYRRTFGTVIKKASTIIAKQMTADGKRQSGILLHPTSLPGPFGSGDLGEHAYRFVDWLASAGQSWWQMLPVGPPGMANSPYMSLSAFAGSELLVDLVDLRNRGWLSERDLIPNAGLDQRAVRFRDVQAFRSGLLRAAAKTFLSGKGEQGPDGFEEFCAIHKDWLDDYALFKVLSAAKEGKAWTAWPAEVRFRDQKALRKIRSEDKEAILVEKFIQWRFFSGWKALRSYAASKGISIMGDLPIFVAHNSADVWSHQDLFFLDEKGEPTVVAGVPPDYFSATGQRWGNPLYRWDIMQQQGYGWWKSRLRSCMELFDLVRIDHFRGFEAYWEIPVAERTAVKGKWVKGPGAEFFRAMKRSMKVLPIVAEDLGVITPEVTAIRDAFGLPGMKVLQFAFAGGPDNGFLPHHHTENTVVYTGTHDNDTSLGWYQKATEHERDFARRYFRTDGHEINWTLIRSALQSVGRLALFPLQDVLGLSSDHRMNLPGTTDGNWEWRFTWDMIRPEHSDRLYETTALAGRCSGERLVLIPYPEGRAIP